MSDVVVLGAGLGGTIAAYELRDKLGSSHAVSVVANGSRFHFVPSNPWVGVGWRDKKAVEVDLAPVFAKRNIALHAQGAKRVHPTGRRIELNDGGSGKWVHAAKIAFEKYFLHKIRSGQSEPFYERLAMQALGIDKLKNVKVGAVPDAN